MANYRAKKAGMAFHSNKKLEDMYNKQEAFGTPQRLMEWFNKTLNGEHPQCSGSSWRKLQFHFRDGTALCKFMNKLRVSAGMAPMKYQTNALTPFVAKENINLFNKAAVEYGLSSDATFQSEDLYDGPKGPFLNVINALNKIGFIANSKDFSPQFEALEPPEAAENGV